MRAARRSQIWQRSVRLDKSGIPQTAYGRADFIFLLFMHGFSLQELCEGLGDGCVPFEVIEDAIRYGMRPKTGKR